MDTTPDLFEAIAQLTKERDELRAQIQSITEGRSHYMKIAADLYLEKEQVQTKLDNAAQYVRGLEAAAQTICKQYEEGLIPNTYQLAALCEALAAKEDRG